jgi:hypothetical protein
MDFDAAHVILKIPCYMEKQQMDYKTAVPKFGAKLHGKIL